MTKDKVCIIFNFAPHYRMGIFKLIDNTFSCDFFFGNKADDIKKIDYNTLKNFKKELSNKTFIKRPFYIQKGAINLIFKKYKIYLISGELYSISTWIILLIGKITHKKIYLWSHGWYGKENSFKSLIKKKFFTLPEGTFLYGNYARNLMINEGLSPDKLKVIYNSLNFDEHKKLSELIKANDVYQHHYNNANKNLIFISRLTKIKKVDLLINALVVLKNASKFYNLTIIGDGEEKNRLVELTNSLNLKENVWFYGACFNEKEIANLIYNADLCISPGNVGLSAIHALTFGTPVITHNDFKNQMPEFEAIIPNKTGDFFESNNYNSLAQTISDWFVRDLDRNSIRKNCYEIIENKYNPHIQLQIIKNTLKE